MSNPTNKDQTQELIKETAKHLFFVKGKFDATTQEIADEAGVNRTLINYYFRSRDNLLNIIFEEANAEEAKKYALISRTDIPFKEKIGKYIDKSLKTSLKYPYLETYIVTQLNKGNNCTLEKEINKEEIEVFYQSINEEMEKGNISQMEPIQFLLNLISLLVFPTAMRPLLSENLKVADKEFDRIIGERKQIIVDMLFKN